MENRIPVEFSPANFMQNCGKQTFHQTMKNIIPQILWKTEFNSLSKKYFP